MAIVGVAGGLALVVCGLDQRERDRTAILQRVSEIERKLRAHDGTEWVLVEGGFPPGAKHPDAEPAHDLLRADLDRLAHLEGLRLVVQQIDVQADTALVDYSVEGRSVRSTEPAAPAGGRFTLCRAQDGWALTGNRFREAPV